MPLTWENIPCPGGGGGTPSSPQGWAGELHIYTQASQGTPVGFPKLGGCHLLVSPFAEHSQLKGKHQPLSVAFLKINSDEDHNDSIGLSFSELLVSVVLSTKWMVPDQTCHHCWYLRQVRGRSPCYFPALWICTASKPVPRWQPINSAVSWASSSFGEKIHYI